MDDVVSQYFHTTTDEHRALFARVHRLLLQAYPEVRVGMSYGMPTYRIGDCRLTVGLWKHGLSFYGANLARAAENSAAQALNRLSTGVGTTRVRVTDATFISDEEFRALFAAALDPASGPASGPSSGPASGPSSGPASGPSSGPGGEGPRR